MSAKVQALVIADDAAMDASGKVTLSGIFHALPINQFPKLGQHSVYVAVAGITGDADLLIEFVEPGRAGAQQWSVAFPIRGSLGPEVVHAFTIKGNFVYQSPGLYHCRVMDGSTVLADLPLPVG